jgi:hypothetical protein
VASQPSSLARAIGSSAKVISGITRFAAASPASNRFMNRRALRKFMFAFQHPNSTSHHGSTPISSTTSANTAQRRSVILRRSTSYAISTSNTCHSSSSSTLTACSTPGRTTSTRRQKPHTETRQRNDYWADLHRRLHPLSKSPNANTKATCTEERR